MKVKLLIYRQKYYTPIEICGGRTPKDFFYKRFDRCNRMDAINEFGDRLVGYFYYTTDYDKFEKLPPIMHQIFNRIFHWINPQKLVIELCKHEVNK